MENGDLEMGGLTIKYIISLIKKTTPKKQNKVSTIFCKIILVRSGILTAIDAAKKHVLIINRSYIENFKLGIISRMVGHKGYDKYKFPGQIPVVWPVPTFEK